jgi:hypothetical protein
MSPGIPANLCPFSDGRNRGIMAFAENAADRYIAAMSRQPATTGRIALRLVLATLAFGGLTGVAFAAWVENGSAMLMALAANGMAWCF